MPKAKPVGLSADTKVYNPAKDSPYQYEPYTAYRLLRNGEVILESSRSQTRDYVLARMQEREAEKLKELAETLILN